MFVIWVVRINLVNFIDPDLKYRCQAGLVLKNKSKAGEVHF